MNRVIANCFISNYNATSADRRYPQRCREAGSRIMWLPWERQASPHQGAENAGNTIQVTRMAEQRSLDESNRRTPKRQIKGSGGITLTMALNVGRQIIFKFLELGSNVTKGRRRNVWETSAVLGKANDSCGKDSRLG